MAGISAAQVKELRDRTGAGMMECKRALVETGGDIEIAIEHMRKAGLAKADKKAGRIAAEGLVVIRRRDDGKAATVVEVNSETDFVAKNAEFQAFAQQIADLVLDQSPSDVDSLSQMALGTSSSVEERRRELVAKIGENVSVRRFQRIESQSGLVSAYCHGTRIGVLVEMQGGDEALGKDIAMHIAASRPEFLTAGDVSGDVLNREKEILMAQAKDSGKPDAIIEKMVQGRLQKFLKEITLMGQPYVKDPDQSVESLLKKAGASVVRFARVELGEGIERRSEDFAEEVMAQVRGE